jgi:hypothetical protein
MVTIKQNKNIKKIKQKTKSKKTTTGREVQRRLREERSTHIKYIGVLIVSETNRAI